MLVRTPLWLPMAVTSTTTSTGSWALQLEPVSLLALECGCLQVVPLPPPKSPLFLLLDITSSPSKALGGCVWLAEPSTAVRGTDLASTQMTSPNTEKRFRRCWEAKHRQASLQNRTAARAKCRSPPGSALSLWEVV